MIKSAEGSAGLLHKITKPAAWRGGAQIWEKEDEDVSDCWTDVKQRGKNGQSIGNVTKALQYMEDNPWKMKC